MFSPTGQTDPGSERVRWVEYDPPYRAFTLIELLVVISIISLLVAILLPALSGARETSRRTVCGSSLRQFGIALSQYATDFDGWFPAKPHFGVPNATVADLAGVQNAASPEWGPNFAGMIRDIVERKASREDAAPTYLPGPKVMLCPSDSMNNIPGNPGPLTSPTAVTWPTQPLERFSDLPRSLPDQATKQKSFISYFYIALWRNDDRGDFILMADQSNEDDTVLGSFGHGLSSEDNHGTRGMNILITDLHVEWGAPRSGSIPDVQELSNRYWGPIILSRPRYGGGSTNRSQEVQTIE